MMISGRAGKNFVMIMIIIALSALLLRFTISKLIKLNIEQNQSYAEDTLRLISNALENYAKNNRGIYPANVSELLKAKPPYLEKDYLSVSPLRGYDFDCPRLDSAGYNCSATPIRCRLSGRSIYSVSTGGLIVAEGCDKGSK